MTSAVTIIGAGSAGLATAAALRKRGIEPVILERGDGVATSWRQRHEELRLNTIRWMSDLPGLRLPRSLGRWVSRDDYVAYLERYALHHRFDIRFNIQVNRIDATDAGWCLETANGLMQTEHVVLATGHDLEPHLPDWPGSDSFSGRIVHVAQLSRAADLVGESVLLVGAGNSGVEIAGHLVNAGVSQLWVSVRTPPNIMPRELVGVPLHPITLLLQILPEPMRDGVARAVGRLAFGDLTRYGLSTPQQGPYARLRTSGVTVAVDQGFVDHLKSGHLKIVAEVDRFEGHKVVLGNGQVLRPDIVLAATGFCNGLNPLVGHLGILDTRHRPPSHSSAPGLWFIGFRVAIEGNLRQHPREAAQIAGAIAKARTDSARGRTRRRLWTGNATVKERALSELGTTTKGCFLQRSR